MEPSELRRDLRQARKRVESLECLVRELEAQCSHDWDVQYTPVHHKGYADPGDPPGTMGVDRLLPYNVPSRDEDMWVRTCRKCGKSQVTERWKMQTRKSALETVERKVPLWP